MSEPKYKGHRYPWEYWFSHNEILLEKRVHYESLDHGFAQYIRRAARRYGYKVSLVVSEGKILMTIHGKVEPRPEVHDNTYRKRK